MGWTTYSDVGEVYELNAVYDDRLKKNMDFITYAIKVANSILMDRGITAKATYGKWGARLEPLVNPQLTRQQIEVAANAVFKHSSWKALKESTYVFTYGQYDEDIEAFQETIAKNEEGSE